MPEPQAQGFEEPSLPDRFRAIFRGHPAGVAIITLRDGERPVGFTATSVISVSADPPVVAFSVLGTSSSWPALSRADSVVIHFLDAGSEKLAARFAVSGIDRFEAVGWTALESGEPRLADVATWAKCRILSRNGAGGSFVVLAEIEAAAVGASREPMVYHDRSFRTLAAASAR